MDPAVELNNGVRMPRLGLGTYRSRGSEAVEAVSWALQRGYRLIDTSLAYWNEEEVARGLRQSGVAREDVFLTSKLENDDHGYESTLAAIDRTLANLDTDYVDLYLVHWPVPGLREDTWRAMEQLHEAGKARAIGVSNYTVRHLEEMTSYARITPAVNQCEFHPFLYQEELLRRCLEAGIQFESYSPLAKARRLDDPVLNEVGAAHGKTAAQVMIRWHLQRGSIPIPKSVQPSHIDENWDVWDFELDGSEMARLDALDEDHHFDWNPEEEA